MGWGHRALLMAVITIALIQVLQGDVGFGSKVFYIIVCCFFVFLPDKRSE